MNESWDAYMASPADFAGADDIINLATEREPYYYLTAHGGLGSGS